MRKEPKSTSAEEITPQEWEWVQELIRGLERDGEDDCRRLVKSLLEWDSVVKAFRKTEIRRMVQRTPTQRDLELHGFCSHALLRAGRGILLHAREKEARIDELGYRLEDIAAYVEELEQDLREWHTHGLTDLEVAKAEKVIFQGASTPLHR
jgi:hypothetical protein